MTIAEQLRREGVETGIKKGREKGIETGLKKGIETGLEKGREETQRKNLLELLRLRFGALPEPVLVRIRQADLPQMHAWFERGATATTLTAVFSDAP